MMDIHQVRLPKGFDDKDWEVQKPHWRELGNTFGLFTEFDEITLKARYVIGVMLQSFECVSILFRSSALIDSVYYPAYQVFSSAIELLGRVVTGEREDRNAVKALTAGFSCLADPDCITRPCESKKLVVAETLNYKYEVGDLVALRHFTAHGQAILKTEGKQFDYLLLGEFPSRVADTLERYLVLAANNESVGKNLALANVTPYSARPMLDATSRYSAHMEKYPKAIAAAIGSMDWTYKHLDIFGN